MRFSTFSNPFGSSWFEWVCSGQECLPEVLLGAELSGLAVLNSLLDGEHDGGVLVGEVHAENIEMK